MKISFKKLSKLKRVLIPIKDNSFYYKIHRDQLKEAKIQIGKQKLLQFKEVKWFFHRDSLAHTKKNVRNKLKSLY
jgi:hypothetical protein